MPRPTPRTVRVELSARSYDIEIGSGTLSHVSDFLAARCKLSHVVLITDTNVVPLVGEPVAERLTEAGVELEVMVVDAGESSKCADVAADLWESMLDEGADRQSVVVAVGGGVVGDLAGFVAATFTRGLSFFQIPTTLLAQVDSSVGGKVGINLSSSKNMVGAFWQPRGVLIDIDVLKTLPEREFRAGMAEVVKYGVIMDAEFFAYLEEHVAEINRREPAAMMYLVERSCQLKAQVVQQDEREETGRRAILNYGHTFAHAFEAASGYENLLHGEAVAIGMLCASRLAERRGMVDRSVTTRQRELLKALGLPTTVPDLPLDDVQKLMWHDKKIEDGRLRFVLPTRIGEVVLVSDAQTEDVSYALEETGD
jgi:3-dehydroquinate synthase